MKRTPQPCPQSHFFILQLCTNVPQHIAHRQKLHLKKCPGTQSRTAVQQPASHSHTHENFGNDDMYSTFVHSQQTNDAGSCNFNLSQILWKQHSKAPMFEQPLFKMAFFFFNGSLNSKDRAFARMQKGSSSLKLFTNGLEIPCMHMHVHKVEHPCIASAV